MQISYCSRPEDKWNIDHSKSRILSPKLWSFKWAFQDYRIYIFMNSWIIRLWKFEISLAINNPLNDLWSQLDEGWHSLRETMAFRSEGGHFLLSIIL